MRVLSIGDNCIDVYVSSDLGYVGGGCVNTAVHLSRLGLDCHYSGAIGWDKSGDFLCDTLRAEGVGVDAVQRHSYHTALAFVQHVDGERFFLGSFRGARYQFEPEKLSDEFISGFDLIHTTLDGRVDHLLGHWKSLDVKVSFDFSHRFLPEQLDLLPNIDYAFFSGRNVESADVKVRLREYHEMGGSLVVMTRGEDGGVAYDGEKYYSAPAVKVPPPIIDTLGCGDAFIAAFIHQLTLENDVEKALHAAAAYASKKLKVLGGFGASAPLTELGIKVADHVMYEKPRP